MGEFDFDWICDNDVLIFNILYYIHCFIQKTINSYFNMASAANLYHSVINDVVSSVRDSFLDESVDENVLQELKTLWESKLTASKTIDPPARASEALLDARMADATAQRAGGGGMVRSQQPGAGAAAGAANP